mmetsp:Transcript_5400/g.14571  ORF Transcript_5400/g.14571 Transcript_5400/m.14571 type:complete len:208 (+) Transcript_5400:558-1181(+)
MVWVPHHSVLPAGGIDGHRCAGAHIQLQVLRRPQEHGIHQGLSKAKSVTLLDLLLGVLGVLALVQVRQPFQAPDLGHIDVQHLKVGVQGSSELKRLIVGVDDAQVGAELLAVQGHAVYGLELVGPHGQRVVVLREHQLHRGLWIIGVWVGAGGGDSPVQVPCKAMLLHGARPKLGEAVGQTTGNGLALVEHSIGAHVQDFVPAPLLP